MQGLSIGAPEIGIECTALSNARILISISQSVARSKDNSFGSLLAFQGVA